jgi:hypothetical protein
MTHPNQYTLTEKGKTFGLHRYKDGVLTIVQQHSSGDWITLGPPTATQVKIFEGRGVRVQERE